MSEKRSKGSPSTRICNLLPSRDVERDWRYEHAVAAGALQAAGALPKSVDLREAWWAIGDQRETGSCVGWASTDGLIRYHMVKTARLGKEELLSPRFTWMASKETDEFVSRPETFVEGAGTSLKAAMDILRKYGAAPEALLPFKISTAMYLGDGETFYATVASRRIAAYFNLGKNLDQWRSWLATRGPLLAGLQVDATWDNATSTKGRLDEFKPATARGGHAICIVGYTTDNSFIIRNSWGKAWGDKGFAYASKQYIQSAFFGESYGATL